MTRNRAEEECKTLGESYNEGYQQGRTDGIIAIQNDFHKRLIEEMSKPYQNQPLCQALYLGIQRCSWYLDDSKEVG